MDVGERVCIPLVVLIPRSDPPFKPILVFHGHESGADYVLGHYPDEETAQANLAIDNNYAQALAEAGYLVCVVEQRGLGRRLTAQVEDKGYPSSCRHPAFTYLLLGRTLLGERITAVVVSDYFNSFADSILAMPHCECNYVPGLLSLGEMGELAASITPRPQCIIHGRQDPIFPVEAVQSQFEIVGDACRQTGSPDACHLHVHEGGHTYHIQASLTWFERWLGPNHS